MVYVVLGLPRSGTSAVAGVLHYLNIHMGFEFIQLEKEPAQTFEDTEWASLCDSITESGMEIGHITKEHVTIFDALVAKRIKYTDWGVKVVGLAALWPLLKDLPDIRVIHCTRDIERCIKSWMSFFDDCDVDLVRKMMLSQISNNENIKPELIIDFDEIFDTKDRTLTTIANFVGKELKKEAIDWVDVDARRY